MDNLVAHYVKEAKATAEANAAAGAMAEKTVYTLLFVGLLISIGMGLWITRSITAPVLQALEVSNRLAEGDLTVSVDSHGKDEVAQFLSAMGNMIGEAPASGGRSAGRRRQRGLRQLSSSPPPPRR